MTKPYDLIIRNGMIADGTGAEPFTGDVAVKDGIIAAVGKVEGAGVEEIDAKNLLVTPGFVDVHTHYDGQAIWSERLQPSSAHGTTTVVMGNCGVGFAPCHEKDRQLLINAMEGVEDIPGVVMAEGLTWEWETFPEFLDALERRRHDIDLAAYIPHSALRVYVMGERGANGEPATDGDLAKMVELTGDAMRAGAVGFATSNMFYHRRNDGKHIPSFRAAERELKAIAHEVGRYGGIFQIVSQMAEGGDDAHSRSDFDFLRRVAKEAALPVTFTTGQADSAPHRLPILMDWVEEANKEEGVVMRPQLFPRPVGMILGLDLSANPFMERPSYKAIAALSLEQKVAELRKPEVRKKILSEESGAPTLPLMAMARKFEQMFALREVPNYEPAAETSVAAIARQRGVTPDEIAYDLLLERRGNAMLLVTLANYSLGSLEPLFGQLLRRGVVIGLGDGGAHYGLICDASYTTFMLSYWARDRVGNRYSIADTVRAMTSVPAGLVGFVDRGELVVGKRADINMIDMEALLLHAPTIQRDLPAGGKRLVQKASGYRYTLVNGRVIQRDGVPTGELPGKVIRANKVRRIAGTASAR